MAVLERLKKHKWVIALLINLLIAVLIGVTISLLNGHATAGGPTKPPSPTLSATPSPSPSASSTVPALYNLKPKLDTKHWVSWAILDRANNVFAGSKNWRDPSYLMSMIKPWIVADYLNRHPNPSKYTLDELSRVIVYSDDELARKYFGEHDSFVRFKKTCGIANMVERSWSWSLTEISARDAVLYADCIYSGKATSKRWTAWIVDKMKHVKGDGDFGIRELFQDRTQVATKNGWFFWEGKWYVNCLAVTSKWAISVLQQWPYTGGDLQYGIGLANPVCKSVANQVLRLNAL